LLAIETLRSYGACESAAQLKQNIVQAIKAVASKLGNTPAVCRKCYVHPLIIEAYLEGQLVGALEGIAERNRPHTLTGLSPQEGLLLGFLRQHAVQED
jgi:DNA topoisomerase-1